MDRLWLRRAPGQGDTRYFLWKDSKGRQKEENGQILIVEDVVLIGFLPSPKDTVRDEVLKCREECLPRIAGTGEVLLSYILSL